MLDINRRCLLSIGNAIRTPTVATCTCMSFGFTAHVLHVLVFSHETGKIKPRIRSNDLVVSRTYSWCLLTKKMHLTVAVPNRR
jgi:hypothetical protein